MLDEADNLLRINLSKHLSEDIDEWSKEYYAQDFRTHMGASVIGHDCFRYVWLSFRWIKKEDFGARTLRLFQRGHNEENSFIKYLKGIGCEVIQFNEETKEQIKVSAANGHFGGSVDAIVKLPEKYGYDEWILAEFKTSMTGAKFNKLVKEGVRVNNYQHHVQMNVYMHLLGLNNALYMCVNKNDDSLHIEIVEKEYNLGESTVQVAHNLIHSNEAPKVIRKSPAAVPCTYCNFKEVCHKGLAPDKNCRSCKYAKAGPNKSWICTQFNGEIPSKFIAKGCDKWWPIVNGD